MTFPTDPINLDAETIPTGFCLIEGKLLQATVRATGISYRLAIRKVKYKSHPDTIGIIIAESDREKMVAAMARKVARKILKQKYVNAGTR